jgi:tetratricopeptide (TPR) repeat protein
MPRLVTIVLVMTVAASAAAAQEEGTRGPLDPDAAADYRKARRHLDHHRADQALAVAKDLPELTRADWRRLDLLAESAMSTGRPAAARTALSKLRDVAPTLSERFESGLSLVELMLLGSDLNEAEDGLEWLDERVSELEDAVRRDADRRYLLARYHRARHDLALARDNNEGARDIARRLSIEFPAEEATRADGLADSGDLSDQQRFQRAIALFDAWEYRKARDIFESLQDHPDHGVEARWHLAQIGLDKLRDRVEQAKDLLEGLSTPGGKHAEEAQYLYARTFMRQENYDRALTELNRYLERYPSGAHVEDVHYYRGWLPYDHRENERAIEGFEAYLDRYGYRSGRSSLVYGFLAWTYMRMSRWEEAIETYPKMNPFGNMLVWGKALYWQAVAHRKLGDDEQALERLDRLRERYPVTYYGVLGEQLRARIQGEDPRASEVWWPEGSGRAADRPRVKVMD